MFHCITCVALIFAPTPRFYTEYLVGNFSAIHSVHGRKHTAVTLSGPFSVLCNWANCDAGRRPMDGARASTYREGSNEATQASSLFLRRRLDFKPNISWEAF